MKTITFSEAGLQCLQTLMGSLHHDNPLWKDLSAAGCRWNGNNLKAESLGALKLESIGAVYFPDFGKSDVKLTEQFIIWSPEYPKPPSKIFESKDVTDKVALKLADKEPGKRFYICRLEAYAEVQPKAQIQKL